MFKGRRSGRSFAIPVSYIPGTEEDGKQLLCMTDINGVWWRNLLEARSIRIVHKGKNRRPLSKSLSQIFVKSVTPSQGFVAAAA